MRRKKDVDNPNGYNYAFFCRYVFPIRVISILGQPRREKKKRKNWNMRARFEVGNRCISHVTTDCFIVINNKKGLALPANWSALFGVVFGGNTCSRNIPSFSAGPRIIIVCYK